jgi:glycosyltransferase involved in cell wall biosynthesis
MSQKIIHIGLYLGFRCGSGGIFQYSLSMLDALCALPAESYKIIVAYEDPSWQSYFSGKDIEVVHIGTQQGERKSLGWLWGTLCLPLLLWKIGFWRLDKTARFFANSNADYWIFPAQDHWTYLARVPAIGVIHDLMHRYESQFPEVSSKGRYFLREHRFRSICRAAKAILVDSETGKKHAMESYGIAAEKIHPLPYVPPRYIYNKEVPEDFVERFLLSQKYFFYPAQFYPHKNHLRLLQAITDIRKDCPDIHLVLAGPKNHAYSEIVAEAKRLGIEDAVSFIGYVPDEYLPELYRRARALVMPTFFGPTNIPPLEAQALGCPVIISGTYGMPEQSGDAAYYIEPSSVDSIAVALKTLWNDDAYCISLRNKGYERAKSWKQDDFSRRMHEILRLIGGGV